MPFNKRDRAFEDSSNIAQADEDELEVYIEGDAETYCLACGSPIKRQKVSMLVCVDCLGEDCEVFCKKAAK